MNLRAYAKINIGLRILGKRSDGYHDIETIFHQIDMYDELSFDPAETIQLTTSSSEVPRDSKNLCFRAAELLREHTGQSKGVHIGLTKHIPVGGGLGGGSSDAATVLVALNDLWGSGMNLRELESLAARLGSDVPFFVQGGTAVGTSRGEVLDHFELNLPYWILTVTPSIHVSTAWAYSNLKLRTETRDDTLRSWIEKSIANAATLRGHIGNDFEDLVFGTYSKIQELKTRLDGAGAEFTQLSGSGSSVFALFRYEMTAHKAMKEFRTTYVTSLTAPGFKPTRTL